jgi:hypothetical protein
MTAVCGNLDFAPRLIDLAGIVQGILVFARSAQKPGESFDAGDVLH